MFLAGISEVHNVPVVDKHGHTSNYFVATDVALANAACLLGQMREIENGYTKQLGDGEQLGHFLHGPLRSLSLDQSIQKEIDDFRKAGGALLGRQWTEPRESPAFTCKGAWHNRNEPVNKRSLIVTTECKSASVYTIRKSQFNHSIEFKNLFAAFTPTGSFGR
jgi:hypothetical protein